MSIAFVQASIPATLPLSPSFSAVALFSLLGLAVSAAAISYVSSETAQMMFSAIG